MDAVNKTIRVLIVDDDALVRSGLQLMLAGAAGIDVVGEVADGRGVLAAIDRYHTDVVLMDIRMPQLDGIAATRLLRSQPRPPAVLMLTTFQEDELVLRALRAGAAGFLLKDTPPAEIVRAIELVGAGESMLSPEPTSSIARTISAGGVSLSRKPAAPARSARNTSSSSWNVVSMSTAGGRGWLRSSRVAAIPSSCGMRMSMRTTSVRYLSIAARTPRPSATSPTTSIPAAPASMSCRPERTSASSSTIRTRVVSVTASTEAWPAGRTGRPGLHRGRASRPRAQLALRDRPAPDQHRAPVRGRGA